MNKIIVTGLMLVGLMASGSLFAQNPNYNRNYSENTYNRANYSENGLENNRYDYNNGRYDKRTERKMRRDARRNRVSYDSNDRNYDYNNNYRKSRYVKTNYNNGISYEPMHESLMDYDTWMYHRTNSTRNDYQHPGQYQTTPKYRKSDLRRTNY